ncbi:hypothetical protein FE394_12170 [Xenorhabdus sp. Reich]|uniref:DUF4105 domain-containing protein n=1 Tax=Xenorhabdus littoralis TaxID=2582835 RepID=A0ABU4SMQ7_9GAMM|nr:hypothetical protein [Xenorhabdus sp. Reich]MDX7999941.1 hypothetical protein [Xenorhabdus sp. Reich]
MNPRTRAESEILAGRSVDATVYIWYPCRKFLVGHSSIYIGGVPQYPWPNFRPEDPVTTSSNKRIRPQDDNYVSFLAGSSRPSVFRVNLSFPGVFHNLHDDFVESPHLEYYLLGLNVPEMQRKKNEMYNGNMYGNLHFPPTYHPIYKNCSTLVARILKSGGVDQLLNPIQIMGYAKNIYWTPKDIAQLCNKLRDIDKAVKVRGLNCPDKFKSPFRTLMGFR